MAKSPPTEKAEASSGQILSPFAQTSVTFAETKKGSSRKIGLWVLLSVLFTVFLGASAFVAYTYIKDPYRTLEIFPFDKYFADYRGLSGAKFRAELRVEADLGWQNNVGRLMAFSQSGPTVDSRLIVVLLPPQFAGSVYNKGQTYIAEINVGEGGMIYAVSMEKH
jgi:hypothetical protein